MADYEVRTWEGWHHHQTLSLFASWFLTREKMIGGKKSPNLSVPQVRRVLAELLHDQLHYHDFQRIFKLENRIAQRKEAARCYHCKTRNVLPPKRLNMRK